MREIPNQKQTLRPQDSGRVFDSQIYFIVHFDTTKLLHN